MKRKRVHVMVRCYLRADVSHRLKPRVKAHAGQDNPNKKVPQ